MPRLLALAASIALASCSQPDDAPVTKPIAGPPSGVSGAAPATPAVPTVVPKAFRGVWDYVKGSCNPASDLRVEIKERSIEFYESHGDIEHLSTESPEIILVDLAMEGEGETWTMNRRFTLSEDGSRLTQAAVGEAKSGPMPLKRCPS